MLIEKRYIGDAVYADFDGFHIVLTISNGINDTNTIGLEPGVLNEFDRYRADLKKAIEEMHK